MKDNFGLSLGRLISLYKQLQAKNPQSFENFKKIIAEQEERGIIEKLDAPFEETELLCPIHYIPWQVVFKVQANFTKERIVYNASAKCGKGARSLNECLFKGPDLNTQLLGMLLNCRFKEILVCCDIEKAFLMVGINPSDRDCLRFLWR